MPTRSVNKPGNREVLLDRRGGAIRRETVDQVESIAPQCWSGKSPRKIYPRWRVAVSHNLETLFKAVSSMYPLTGEDMSFTFETETTPVVNKIIHAILVKRLTDPVTRQCEDNGPL